MNMKDYKINICNRPKREDLEEFYSAIGAWPYLERYSVASCFLLWDKVWILNIKLKCMKHHLALKQCRKAICQPGPAKASWVLCPVTCLGTYLGDVSNVS